MKIKSKMRTESIEVKLLSRAERHLDALAALIRERDRNPNITPKKVVLESIAVTYLYKPFDTSDKKYEIWILDAGNKFYPDAMESQIIKSNGLDKKVSEEREYSGRSIQIDLTPEEMEQVKRDLATLQKKLGLNSLESAVIFCIGFYHCLLKQSALKHWLVVFLKSNLKLPEAIISAPHLKNMMEEASPKVRAMFLKR